MKNRTIGFLILTIFILLPTSLLFSQQNDRPLLPLSDEDFACFQTVDCVLSSDELKKKGWNFTIDGTVENHPQELTFNMKGENVFLNAAYSKEGNLIRAKYQLFDRAVPTAILNKLGESDYQEWTVVANTLTVRNFESATAEFALKLQKGESSETMQFTLSEIETDHTSNLVTSQPE